MLHTVNKSCFQNGALESCLRFAQDGDPILLIEDGVFAALADTSKSGLIEKALGDHQIYAISADVKARGLEKLIPEVKVIGYDGFVDLVEEHKTHAWL